jgi:hypothetical protein
MKAPKISNPPTTCKTRSYHEPLYLPEIPLQNKSNAKNSRAIPWPSRWVSRGATGETGDHILPVRCFLGRSGSITTAGLSSVRMKRRDRTPPALAPGVPNVGGRRARRTAGFVPASTSGTHLIPGESAHHACTSGLLRNAPSASSGRCIQTGMRNDLRRGVLGFATCETSHPELAETLEPTKRRQWRFGKQDASPCPPSPPRPPRD